MSCGSGYGKRNLGFEQPLTVEFSLALAGNGYFHDEKAPRSSLPRDSPTILRLTALRPRIGYLSHVQSQELFIVN